ncbi:hypothetical protein [Streptomyces sp. NPDC057287]|uniref:hypothetical protein n=1 Tax=Streptomyces sp. NPDC057287 TaxID=3346086 RepID=UPI00362E7767
MNDTPPQHLTDAADGIRAFNHASQSTGPGWEAPTDSYTALGTLSYLVGILGQAVEQSTAPVRHAYEQGRIRIDGNGNTEAKFGELLAAREEGIAAAAALTAAVQRMHNAVSPMGYDTTGLPELEDDEEHVV